MKAKLTALSIIFLLSTAIIAQEETNKNSSYQGNPELFPQKGDLGVTLLLSGLIDNLQLQSPRSAYGQNQLFLRYYLKDDMALRLGFGLDLRNYRRETADSLGMALLSRDSLNRRYTLNVSGGLEKHLSASNRLDPYVFGQLNLSFIGKERIEVDEVITSSVGEATQERVIKRDGGIAIGLLVGGGMNYFIAKRFSMGAEIGLLLQYSNVGGTISDNTISTDPGGNTDSDFNTSEDLVREFTSGVDTQALINLSYFF